MKYTFIRYCEDNNYPYECGYDWCDCVDFNDYVNALINGKWHTLYCLNNGSYRFDKTIVKSIEDIKGVLENAL